MCVRTLSSDPAHLQFSLNCLPNEEEIKKIKVSTYRSTNYLKELKNLLKRAYETCGYHNLTTRKDSNKNQIVTNINYDQKSLSIF